MKTIESPQGGRQVRLTLALVCFALALLVLFVLVGQADAAPVTGGGGHGERITFEAKITGVHCFAGLCSGWCEGRYNGKFGGPVRGFFLRTGLATVTGTVYRGYLSGAWAVQ